jgi:hypothetical protein
VCRQDCFTGLSSTHIVQRVSTRSLAVNSTDGADLQPYAQAPQQHQGQSNSVNTTRSHLQHLQV